MKHNTLIPSVCYPPWKRLILLDFTRNIKAVMRSTRMAFGLAFFLYGGLNAQDCLMDSIAPTLLLKPLILQMPDSGYLMLRASDFDDGSSDNCDPAPRFYFDGYLNPDYRILSYLELGRLQFLNVYLKDSSGNVASARTRFQLLYTDCSSDSIPPLVQCKKQLRVLVGEGDALSALDVVEGLVWENCSELDLSFDSLVRAVPLIRDASFAGQVERIKVFATDASGLQSSCETEIHYVSRQDSCSLDKTAPSLRCKASYQVRLDREGSRCLFAEELVQSLEDACGVQSLSFYYYSEGNSVLVQSNYCPRYDQKFCIYARDLSGNVSSCCTMVRVFSDTASCKPDLDKPLLHCKGAYDCYVTRPDQILTPEELVYSNWDNCDKSPRLSFSSDTKDRQKIIPVSIAGSRERVLVFSTDSAGNTKTCESNVRYIPLYSCFEDHQAPILVCKQDVVYYDDAICGNELVLPWEFIEYGVDNCSGISYSFDPEGLQNMLYVWEFADYYSQNEVMTIYGTDPSGNVGRCSLRIKVVTIPYVGRISIHPYLYTDFWQEDLEPFSFSVDGPDQLRFSSARLNNINSGNLLDISVGSNIILDSLHIDFHTSPTLQHNYLSTADAFRILRLLLDIPGNRSPVNFENADTDCNGEISIVDCKTLIDYLRDGPNSNDCVGRIRYAFLDSAGRSLGSSISLTESKRDPLPVSLDQTGNINTALADQPGSISNPVRRFDQAELQWQTEDLDCRSGQTVEAVFRLSDSSNYFGVQGNFGFDPEYIRLEKAWSLPESNRLYFNLTEKDIQFAGFGSGYRTTPGFLPEIHLQFTALKDFKLHEAFDTSRFSLSNFVLGGDDRILPTGMEFVHVTKNQDTPANDGEWILQPNPVSHELLLINMPPGRSYQITNSAGKLMLSGQSSDHGIIKLDALASGMYLLLFEDQHGKRGIRRFVKL